MNVDIIISRDGRVIEACAVDGPQVLRKAAEQGALATRFKPNFGLSVPSRQAYQREVLAYLFVLNQTEPADELHFIVVRPQDGSSPKRPNPPLAADPPPKAAVGG